MWYIILFFGVLFLDQITKTVVDALDVNKEIIPNILSITNAKNKGAAFSMFADESWSGYLFIGLSIIMITVFCVVMVLHEGKRKWFFTSITLVLSGAIGNVIDRLAIGAVRDFIDVHFFANFNVADMGICVGMAMLAIYYLFMDEFALFSKKKPQAVEGEVSENIAEDTENSNSDDSTNSEDSLKTDNTELENNQAENKDTNNKETEKVVESEEKTLIENDNKTDLAENNKTVSDMDKDKNEN